MTNLELKSKYDTIFDEIFFSKEFIDYIMKNKGYCPSGLTFDTKFDKNNKIYFECCCKKYGYEYSGEHVIGDFWLVTPSVDLEDYAILCFKYLNKVNPEIVKEIEKYDICY